eukprot:TRINITY_DN1013_c1_g1_i4.p1 TRINITY_DN1013_c1_g1~~TRINITY_DN1013_c1_g1_i4.p1  ORF type:complete len:589 (+),score=107.88 TRINITY_DN1013_c1_g1_i4:137-1903(+)
MQGGEIPFLLCILALLLWGVWAALCWVADFAGARKQGHESTELQRNTAKRNAELQENVASLNERLTQKSQELATLRDRHAAVEGELAAANELVNQTTMANTQLEQQMEERRRELDGHFHIEGPITPYDCIITIDSLGTIAQEKSVQFLQDIHSSLNIDVEIKDLRIISCLGYFNKGKTHNLNMLLGKNFPSGKTCHTRGLCCVYVPEKRMLFIDSPGRQATISRVSDNVEPIVDAKNTESFVFELVSQISDYVIFVVEDFTSAEQETVDLFVRKDQRLKKLKGMTVIHNFRGTRDTEEAVMLFEEQIVSAYKGAKTRSDLQYIARHTPPVRHVGVCKELSPAGKRFNEQNRKYVMTHLDETEPLGSENFVLANVIAEHFRMLLPKFFFIESHDDEPWNVKFDSDMEAAEVCVNAVPYLPKGKIVIQTSVLTVKTRGVISEFGEVLVADASFNPKPMIFDRLCEGQGTQLRTIMIPSPGIRSEDVEAVMQGGVLTVTLNRKKLIDESSVEAVEPIHEEYGVWKHTFAFPNNHFDEEPDMQLGNGILTFVLKKSIMKKKLVFGAHRSGPASVAGSECSFLVADSTFAADH